MIKFAFNLAKILVFSVVVLLIGLIPVGQKRISEHVRDITASPLIQTPVNWIAHKFDFVSNGGVAPAVDPNDPNYVEQNSARKKEASRTGYTHSASSDSSSDTNSSDRSRLSGLLKRP